MAKVSPRECYDVRETKLKPEIFILLLLLLLLKAVRQKQMIGDFYTAEEFITNSPLLDNL